MDLVPLKKVLGNGYEQRKLHLALTNLSLIVFSDFSENSYHERYMIDEVKEGGAGRNSGFTISIP